MTAPSRDVTVPELVRDDQGQRAVFETLGSARAMRYLRRDPVSDAHVEALVWAATRAASADNSQPWTFLAVRDPSTRRRIADALASFSDKAAMLDGPSSDSGRRTRAGAAHLLDRLAEAPLLLFVLGHNSYPGISPQERYLWSGVFGATQNVLVAARAMGLGATLTMLHVANSAGVREILGVPADVRIASMIVVGWPARKFGPMTRRPVEQVLRHEHW